MGAQVQAERRVAGRVERSCGKREVTKQVRAGLYEARLLHEKRQHHKRMTEAWVGRWDKWVKTTCTSTKSPSGGKCEAGK